ncbi:MAG: S41 family peptidase [Planctomycetota bacterium]
MKIPQFIVALIATSACSATTFAQDDVSSNWFRNPAISPDGKTIAFVHAGDIYLVDADGGRAAPLTIHEAFDSNPVWSADGSMLAFSSNRFGNNDVFVIPSEGGTASRLTFHSAADTPADFTPDGKHVYFTSRRVSHVDSALVPASVFNELYRVPLTGGTPTMVLTTANVNPEVSPDGTRFLYEDRKGYEDPLRKHHTSSIARDVWIHDTRDGSHMKLTDFAGEDRDPSWHGRDEMVYLSERSGDFNVWRQRLRPGVVPQQLTNFEHHPVRHLTRSDNGTMAFSWHGDLYTLRDGGDANKVDVRMALDGRAGEPERMTMRGGASQFSVASSGKEVAFVVRGEVFVTSTEFDTTRRITATSEQERNVHFSPDGRSLVYAAERDGSWNIYITELDERELYFFSSTMFNERALVATNDDEFQPRWSPDGKKVAYLRGREELRVIDVESGEEVVAMDAANWYSYSDGDMWFRWAPSSDWLAVHFYNRGRIFVGEAGLVKADGSGEIIDISSSGYDDNSPRFAMDGGAFIWASDRYGERPHGSWGAEYDVLGTFLTQDSFDRFRLTKEEYELQKEMEEKEEEDAAEEEAAEVDADENADEAAEADVAEDASDASTEDDDAGDEDTDDDAVEDDESEEEAPDPLEIETDGLDTRTVRLTTHASDLGDFAMAPDGKALYYLASFEGDYDLWKQDFQERSTTLVAKLGATNASMQMSDDGKTIYLLAGGSLSKIEASSGKRTPIKFAAEMVVDRNAERVHNFGHVWRQTRLKFYRPDMHGVDWAFYRDQYAPKLAGVHTNQEFSQILSEMLGELNASHTGGFARGGGSPSDASTATLGVIYDQDYEGPGRRIAEVLENGPLDRAKFETVETGTIILAINGVRLDDGVNYYAQFDSRAGERVRLTIQNGDAEEEDIVVKPISGGAQNQLLYERWVRTREALVEELSGGRLGYAHIRGMNDAAFREFYEQVMGKHVNKEALVVDTRFNGGGWLSDDLATFLSGKPYATLHPRTDLTPGARYMGEPLNRWTKPSIAVMSESNYSDAHIFPWTYTELEVGETVGMPVPGTGTAVWWESLFTGDIVFGIPQVGVKGRDGVYLENTQLEPDHLVNLDPESAAAGRDTQIEKAVEVLLGQLDN